MMQQPLFWRVAGKIDRTLASLLYIEQWAILTARGMDYDQLAWSALTPLFPERDRYWADPFIVAREGRYYVFIEEKLYGGRGRIACLTLDADGGLLERQLVLERDYHLSYPFVFEHEGQLYMLPETAANRTLEIYRCTRFPDSWELHKTLMKGIYATDATLLEQGGKWWMFADVKVQGGSSLNALHLFWAESPFAESWTPHPRNPVVADLGSARPAGRIFLRDGHLIRPSQDSRRRYGYALRFNRIARLSETEYAEETVGTFVPRAGGVQATHTFNRAGDLTVIDAVIRRLK